MTGDPTHEPRRNALLRRADWRFLLAQRELPRTIDLASGHLSQAARIVSDGPTPAAGEASLVVLNRPSSERLRRSWSALRPGGELYCEWRLPMPAGPGRARRRLHAAGFTDVQVLWPWPLWPRGTPQFWLPIDSPAALARFLALRPTSSPGQMIVRRLWRAATRTGVLAPVCAVARRPLDAALEDDRDGLDAVLPSPRSWLLLTGGRRSINKVAGLPSSQRHPLPELIVKFARLSEAEPGLEREDRMLRALASERPELPGIPRVLATGRRAGRLALAESAIYGQPLIDALTLSTFAQLAGRVARWLAGLVDSEAPAAPEGWRARLIEEPLDVFERQFGAVAGPATVTAARRLLGGLGRLPLAWEHRDCSPWNIVLTDAGAPALLDWESAEPRGLPGLDLVYFLTNAAFVIDGALESGRTRETYARLLDPATPIGRVAADCLTDYCERFALDSETVARLRVLCWIIHARSEYHRFEADAGATPDAAVLRNSVFLGLICEETGSQNDTGCRKVEPGVRRSTGVD